MIDFEGSCYGDALKDLGAFIVEVEKLCFLKNLCIPLESLLSFYGAELSDRLKFCMTRRYMVIARYDEKAREWALRRLRELTRV